MNSKICLTACLAAFLAGLIAVGWVAAGYIGASPLALAMTALIGTVYVFGALELLRFEQATATLEQALAAIPDGLTELGAWLDRLAPSLQNPVRLRIEGERVALPGPALTPYLVGLLVLLGMLGTFLGMVVTLKGAVIALESTTDLQAIRASLSAPVKGLGVAFGTSVAGVAASAMLGLASALCRRHRLQAAQLLDTRIATVLRRFSLAHQRQETFSALQSQARALPDMVATLQAMMTQLERQGEQLAERLLAGQQSHYHEARSLHAELAASVDSSLRDSLTAGARLTGETIPPLLEAAVAGIARETNALHGRIADAVGSQLDGIAARFGSATRTVTDTWSAALAAHQRSSEQLNSQLQRTLDAHAERFEQGSAALLGSVGQTHAAVQADLAGLVTALGRDTTRLHETLATTVGTQLDGLSARFGDAVATVTETWKGALARHEHSSDALTRATQGALEAVVERFDQGSTTLLTKLDETHARRHAESAARDAQRLAGMSQALEALAASLQQAWQEAGARTLAHQDAVSRTLETTVRELAASTQAQASRSIEEAARLMHSAAEAPRAAAEVIAQLRQELSASIARDNALLEERSRIMETLAALLEAINHASTEQRGAIDALVSSAATVLERSGARFDARIDEESARMSEAAAQVGSGAVEVASLGEAFGFAVRQFGESNDRLMAGLQRIEGALDKSMARSDEQLAYYVAQARELIDLSLMSQKQIVDDLQRLSGRQASLAGEA